MFGARTAENARGKGPGFDSRRGTPVQHIFLDVDDDEDEVHEEGHKDDEDDEDENEDEDEDEDEDDKRRGW